MKILIHIAPIDYLKVKLVSKRFSKWASTGFKWNEMTKAEVIQGQTSLEASLPRTRGLKDFICTHCGLVKPTKMFSDNQAAKTNHRRICISCGISNRVYTVGRMPKISGEERIPCWHCRQAVPKFDDWERYLRSGKAALTELMHNARTEGSPKMYTTYDGRTLESDQELQALAFCKPCLKRMRRYERSGSRGLETSGQIGVTRVVEP